MAKRSKHTVMNFLEKIYYFILTMICIGIFGGIFIAILSSIFQDDTADIARADGFTIEGYNVVLDVKADNKVFVTEYITVNWNESNHHGIYKFTPQWLEYTGKDDKTIKRKANISSLISLNDPYTTDWVKKKARIKIGSAYSYVPLGEKQYIISYTYDMGSDPYKGFDEFIFHAFGDYWGTEIKNASIQVNMPKSINNYNINFFTDKYRFNNVNDYVQYDIIGNTLYAKFDSEKYREVQYNEYCDSTYHKNEDGTCNDSLFKYSYRPLERSLTIDIELPENYFEKGSWNYGWGSFTIIVITILITIYTIFKWNKYGKNFPKRSKTVEFYPPENLSPAEIGYIYGKGSNKKLTISLIIQLASKGYIKIDDLNDKDKNIQITNLYSKPAKLPSFEKTLPKREIVVNKKKEADTNLSKNALTMMTYLFKKSDTKNLNTSIEKFLKVKEELVNGGYIDILSDNDTTRVDDYDSIKKEYAEKEIQYNKDMAKYLDEISKLKPLSKLERIVYDRLFESNDVIVISEHYTLYKAFNDIESQLDSSIKDMIFDKVATKKMISSIIITVLVIILNLIGYFLIEDMSPNWNILYKVSSICIFINIFFTIFMKRKTEYGEKIKAQVYGFRDFLLKVEKNKLEELVSQNPQYFYDILPYTYVLNISKTWIRKFENIPIPEMDMGTFDYSSDRAYYSMYDNVYYPSTSSSSSRSSSGCSSCGGGCSSCGGGCSSCGGGGSW